MQPTARVGIGAWFYLRMKTSHESNNAARAIDAIVKAATGKELNMTQCLRVIAIVQRASDKRAKPLRAALKECQKRATSQQPGDGHFGIAGVARDALKADR